jgi:hypothetical protein
MTLKGPKKILNNSILEGTRVNRNQPTTLIKFRSMVAGQSAVRDHYPRGVEPQNPYLFVKSAPPIDGVDTNDPCPTSF